jgi:hypothetical protein
MKPSQNIFSTLAFCIANLLISGCAIDIADDVNPRSYERPVVTAPITNSPRSVKENANTLTRSAEIETHATETPPPALHIIETNQPGVVYLPSPPPPKTESLAASPGIGFVWVPGAWAWHKGEWIWNKGHWAVPPRMGSIWLAGRWEVQDGKGVWATGHWR